MDRIVVIGTSAGGIEALRLLVGALPRDFAAPLCVVMHTSAQSPGILPEILARAGQLPAKGVSTTERLENGRIYVASPDAHLVVEPGHVRATKGPRENRFRPAIDPLFRSAAQVFGPAAIGVILTGNLDDGTAGLWAIKRLGGTAIVQDPADALFPSMPRNALSHVDVDHIVPLAALAPLLTDLVSRSASVPADRAVPKELEVEVRIAAGENAVNAGLEGLARPSAFACPDCHGVLLEFDEDGRPRFRCHTGHAYSVESLLAAIDDATEGAMAIAVRALEEAGLFLSAMAAVLEKGDDRAAEFEVRAAEARQQSDAIRTMSAGRASLIQHAS